MSRIPSITTLTPTALLQRSAGQTLRSEKSTSLARLFAAETVRANDKSSSQSLFSNTTIGTGTADSSPFSGLLLFGSPKPIGQFLNRIV